MTSPARPDSDLQSLHVTQRAGRVGLEIRC